MLILQEKFNKQLGHLGLWRIEEDERAMADGLPLSKAESRQLSGIKGQGRRIEFLAARRLLHQLSGRELRGALVKDEFGKPHLEGSDHHVSISHTEQLSAAVAHPAPCGVDVQLFVAKIGRLAKRFMGEAELAQITDANRLIFQHLVWGAKEAMYKAYGRREIDFRDHLFVDLKDIPLEKGRTTGLLKKDALEIRYHLEYRIWERNYMLVVAVKE
ncbi:4-phosphopantetheinyl transferase [Lewinellaceae bacterium SD302]|nr:4-phosphopantetheinyl transferase [Lewinellaceae bacterium SD302]